MSEIPDDIWEAADAVLDSMMSASRPDDLDPRTVAARAILAERERCAKIVSRMLKFADTTSKSDEAILAAIRTPSTGEETP